MSNVEKPLRGELPLTTIGLHDKKRRKGKKDSLSKKNWGNSADFEQWVSGA
jgi:hypothetical protein